jgi:hypothetical protein
MTTGAGLALERFAAWYGIDLAALTSGEAYQIDDWGEDFRGPIERIRLVENGRFGNIVHQIIHAILLGDLIGCREILLFPFAGGPPPGIVEAGGFRVRIGAAAASLPAAPTLVGHFFNSYPFGTMLRGLDPARAWPVLQPVLDSLFSHIEQPARAAAGRGLLAAHFRAGDIFAHGHSLDDHLGKRWWTGAVNPWYVQPPASFYIAAIRAALETGTVREVRLVFEDRGNPAIEVVEAALARDGVAVSLQSQDLLTDVVTLASASHLVASASTMIEAAALFAPDLRSYTAFRQFESHAHIHGRLRPLFAGLLRARGVHLALYRDAGDYIPPLGWNASPDQLALVRDYPLTRLLAVADTPPGEPAGQILGGDLRGRLRQAEDEAARLRQAMFVQRAAAQGYRAQVQAMETSRMWRLTAPLRRLVNVVRQP